MRFQERDGRIILAIHEYGGVLSRRHLKHMFFPHTTLRAIQKRLSKLVANCYLYRPSTEHRKTKPIPEPIIWLGWKGILWLAGHRNKKVRYPSNQGENQMRKLSKQLRDQGISWIREPRWFQLPHDLSVVDFRLATEEAVSNLPFLDLAEWHHEGEFRSNWDSVEYSIVGRDRKITRLKRRLYPDSYFVIVDKKRIANNLLSRARFLLEIDNANHTNERFGREKVAPGLVYIKSPAYKERFGSNSGRWLIVTTGQVRMKNLLGQTQQLAGAEAHIFLFTTFDQLHTDNILTDPIWWQVGRDNPVPIIS